MHRVDGRAHAEPLRWGIGRPSAGGRGQRNLIKRALQREVRARLRAYWASPRRLEEDATGPHAVGAKILAHL